MVVLMLTYVVHPVRGNVRRLKYARVWVLSGPCVEVGLPLLEDVVNFFSLIVTYQIIGLFSPSCQTGS